jgi:hypothetical protein
MKKEKICPHLSTYCKIHQTVLRAIGETETRLENVDYFKLHE